MIAWKQKEPYQQSSQQCLFVLLSLRPRNEETPIFWEYVSLKEVKGERQKFIETE